MRANFPAKNEDVRVYTQRRDERARSHRSRSKVTVVFKIQVIIQFNIGYFLYYSLQVKLMIVKVTIIRVKGPYF